jgi:hypothetical protein
MRTTLLGLTAFALGVLSLHHAPSARNEAPPVPQAVNAIVGDASYLEAFGRAPDATTDEDLRIRTHLNYVLRRLRAVPAAAVPAELRLARARNLERLADYIARGSFPRNPASVHVRTPNFLDAQGRICAVGYLVREDLGAAAVAAINREYQFARIQQMKSEALAAWQETSGLTMLELASIQPEYCPPGTLNPCPGVVTEPDRLTGTRSAEIAVGSSNVALTAFNLIQIGRGQRSRALGLGSVGFGLLGVSLALRDDSGASRFDAAAGILAIVSGLVQASRSSTPAGENEVAVAAAPHVQLGPMTSPGGAQALAVQVRF